MLSKLEFQNDPSTAVSNFNAFLACFLETTKSSISWSSIESYYFILLFILASPSVSFLTARTK